MCCETELTSLKNDEILLENYFLKEVYIFSCQILMDIFIFMKKTIMYYNLKTTNIIENKYHSIILNIEYKQFPE